MKVCRTSKKSGTPNWGHSSLAQVNQCPKFNSVAKGYNLQIRPTFTFPSLTLVVPLHLQDKMDAHRKWGLFIGAASAVKYPPNRPQAFGHQSKVELVIYLYLYNCFSWYLLLTALNHFGQVSYQQYKTRFHKRIIFTSESFSGSQLW